MHLTTLLTLLKKTFALTLKETWSQYNIGLALVTKEAWMM